MDGVAVHPLARCGIEFEALESRHFQAPGVLCGNRINAHAEQRVREGLEQFHDFIAHAGRVGQVFRIAHASQARLLFVGAEAGEIIFLLREQTLKIFLGFRRQRSFFQKFSQARFAAHIVDAALIPSGMNRVRDQLVGPKGFLIEENARLQTQRTVEIFADVLVIRRHINTELFDQSLRDCAIRPRAFNGIRAAESQNRAAAGAEFVALGVSAEVIVVLKNQDARLVARSLAEIVRRGEAADASAHDHQVVGFARVHGLGSVVPEGAVADFVHGFERPGMTSAQAGLAGRIVTWDVLRFQIGGCGSPHFRRNDRSSHRQCDSVQKIPARDSRAHPQRSVAFAFLQMAQIRLTQNPPARQCNISSAGFSSSASHAQGTGRRKRTPRISRTS